MPRSWGRVRVLLRRRVTRFLPAGARARLLTTRRCFGRGLLATQVSKKAASKWVELPFAGEGGQRRPLSQACDHIQSGADWRDLPSAALKAEGRRSACSCCLSTKQKMSSAEQLERRVRSGGLGGDLQDDQRGLRAAGGAGPGVASHPGPPAQREGVHRLLRVRLGLLVWQWREVERGVEQVGRQK